MPTADQLLELQRRIVDHSGGCILSADGNLDPQALEAELRRFGFEKIEHGTASGGQRSCRVRGPHETMQFHVGADQDSALVNVSQIVFQPGTITPGDESSIVFSNRSTHALVFVGSVVPGAFIRNEVIAGDQVELELDTGAKIEARVVRALGEQWFIGRVESVDPPTATLSVGKLIVFTERQIRLCAKA